MRRGGPDAVAVEPGAEPAAESDDEPDPADEPAPEAASEPASAPASGPPRTSPGLAGAGSQQVIAEAVRLARADLERGSTIFFHGKGAKRWALAAEAFTAAIDRLAPLTDALDPDGRLVLARALDYRAQGSLRRGREKEADADFALLIAADPSYSPEAPTASRKVLERFRRIQAARIALVTIQADPYEAEITWNGRPAGSAASLPSEMPVLAGSFVLRARLDCFEEAEALGEIKAGEKRVIPVHLDPIARNVHFESDPAGFDIDLDGTLVGRTAPENGEGPGLLAVRCVQPGDHTFAARRDCYPEVSGSVSVVVDLLDRTPMLVPRIAPVKRAVSLSVETDTPGTDLFIDGARVGPLPISEHTLCPGTRSIEVRAKERLVWSDRVDLEDGPRRLWTPRRPSLRLLIAEGAEPGAGALSAHASRVIRERVAALPGFNQAAPDPAAPPLPPPDEPLPGGSAMNTAGGTAGPGRLELGADLLVAVDTQPGDHGPLLRLRVLSSLAGLAETAHCAEEDAACLDRFIQGFAAPWPRSAPRSGLGLSDSPDRKGVLVLSAEGSARKAGLREGDRVVTANGKDVTTASAFTAMMTDLLADRPSTEVPIVVQRGSQRVETRLPIVRSPVVAPPGVALVPVPRIVAAAELDLSLLPAGEARSAALLNLASVLIGAGEHRGALHLALERPDWPQDVPGAAGSGTASFLAGLCYAFLGEKERSMAAFRRASEDPAATLWEPDGLPVAPLARIQLRALESR